MQSCTCIPMYIDNLGILQTEINMQELEGISSDGILGSTVFTVTDFDKLEQLVEDQIVSKTICTTEVVPPEVIATTQSPVTDYPVVPTISVPSEYNHFTKGIDALFSCIFYLSSTVRCCDLAAFTFTFY